MTSSCLSQYLHTLGRILSCVLCANVNWVAGGVGEGTGVRCGDAGVHLDHLTPPRFFSPIDVVLVPPRLSIMAQSFTLLFK